jgi:hypothetical protein
MRCCTMVAALFLAAVSVRAEAQEVASTPPSTPVIGPSFTCPTPRDPLGELICGSPILARRDLQFVQTYEALRQQLSPEQQRALRAEAVKFGRGVRADCRVGMPVGPNDPLPPPAPQAAIGCVDRDYSQQRATWSARLTGPAAEEADRDLVQQIALQRDLQLLGLLPAGEPIDGVYGTDTRAAIMAFQQTEGLATTGLLGDADAAALANQAVAHGPQAPGAVPPAKANPQPPASRSAWEDFQGEVVAAGMRTSLALDGACDVALQIRDPRALATAVQEYLSDNGEPAPANDGNAVFAAEMAFLRTQFAAQTVHAFYASQPAGIDLCRFSLVAFTSDIYGRDIPQPLFTFQIDRGTYAKIVWDRFDPQNMPKIVLSFSFSDYAEERLRGTSEAGADSPDPAADPAAPVSTPKRDEVPDVAPAAVPVQPPVKGVPASIVLSHWAGTATMITRPFHVDGAWELQWRSDGFFVAELHAVGSGETSIIANASGQAASSAFQPNGGDYFIQFTSTDPWTATIVKVSASP